ncbi:MAG: KH domain-containing protein, partial [Patescibacteria group bacterium]
MDHTLIKDILGRLLKDLDLPFKGMEVGEEGDIVRVDISSDQPSRIIGWHGETLNSLQHLVKSIARSQAKLERSPFIVLDV